MCKVFYKCQRRKDPVQHDNCALSSTRSVTFQSVIEDVHNNLIHRVWSTKPRVLHNDDRHVPLPQPVCRVTPCSCRRWSAHDTGLYTLLRQYNRLPWQLNTRASISSCWPATRTSALLRGEIVRSLAALSGWSGRLVGPGHDACIDQEPSDDGRASTHAMVPATLPGKLVAFKICNRQLVIGVIEWTPMGRKPVCMTGNSIAKLQRLTLHDNFIYAVYFNHRSN